MREFDLTFATIKKTSQEEQVITYLNADWLIHFSAETMWVNAKQYLNEEMHLQKFYFYCMWLIFNYVIRWGGPENPPSLLYKIFTES